MTSHWKGHPCHTGNSPEVIKACCDARVAKVRSGPKGDGDIAPITPACDGGCRLPGSGKLAGGGAGGGRAGALGALVAAGETLLGVRNGSSSGGAGRGGRLVGFLILINIFRRSSASCGEALRGGDADRELACEADIVS